jgi:hypothetical protein
MKQEIEWIPVGPRLPEEGEIVLGFFPDGDESGETVATAVRYGNRIYSDAPTSTAHCFVPTHWCYKPQPPSI